MREPECIRLRGVRVHNLQGINVDLPLHRWSVITGVSGAGKSSLAFDTLYAEAQRRYLQSFSTATRQFLERLDRPQAERLDNLPPAIAVGPRFLPRTPWATVGTITEVWHYLRLLFARSGTLFCPGCSQAVEPARADRVLAYLASLPAGCRFGVAFPAWLPAETEWPDWVAQLREEGFVRIQIGKKEYHLSMDVPPAPAAGEALWVLVDRGVAGPFSETRLREAIELAFARGQGRLGLLLEDGEVLFDQRRYCPRCQREFPDLEPRHFSFTDPLGACPHCQGTGRSAGAGRRRGRQPAPLGDGGCAPSRAGPPPCPACGGSRLGELARQVRVGGKTLPELAALPLEELADFCQRLQLPEAHQATGRLLLEQIHTRLAYLQRVGLGYLSLDRPADTLSSGEAQRVRLTTALGSHLAHALYVLDEPTTGLHPSDTARLREVLRDLCTAGNTLVVVEHDADLIRAADHVVDLGPGAGPEGGRLLYAGPPAGLEQCPASLTGAYLSGRSAVRVPAQRRPLCHGSLRLLGARTHNLQNLTVDIPLGVLCVVTGVSGAGKSSLISETLYPALCRRKHKPCPLPLPEADVLGAGQISEVVHMDQTPLTPTGRSNPATYLKIFDDIRQLFADTVEARIRGLEAGHFSFNQPGGRCETCQGQGMLTVDMQFLADVTVTCPECQGTRYQRPLLEIKVRGRNIAEVLDLTVREAFRFFRGQPNIARRLKLLLDVGLDYLRLGQPTDTLSGGECQRLKLAGHLAASRKPRCLFLLDEPTAGLHPADVARLLQCFDNLLAAGHSLVVIEHNLDVIKCADYVIDLGPGPGAAGGRVVAAGTPEEVAQVPDSLTGRWLRQVLSLA